MQEIARYCCCCRSTNLDSKTRKFRLKSQVAIITVASLVALNHGMSISHAAVLVPQIQAENGTIQIDEDEGTWIASLYNFSSPLGALFGGILIELLGRRFGVMIALGSLAIGWLTIFLSESSGVIMVGRCLEGISKTMAVTSVTVLIDETIHPICRGFVFPQYATMVSLGIFTMMGIANLLSWRTSSLFAAGLSAVSFVSVFLVPETPAWLVRKGRMSRAEKSLRHLWGPSRHQQARETMLKLRDRFNTSESSSAFTSKICKMIFSPSFLKPFLILHIINVFIQLFCGNHLVINYSVDMVTRMAERYDPYVMSTVFSLIRTFVCFVVGITMSVVGRRTFMMISGVGSAVAAIALGGVLFAATGVLNNAETQETLSIVLLGIYVAAFSSGYYIIPSMMIGETQTALLRGYLCGYIYTINDFASGGVIKVYPWLLGNLGLHGIFLMFGVSCIVCTVICYLFLPETNGKTLEEIEDYFKQKNIMWITRNKFLMDNCEYDTESHLYEESMACRRTSTSLNAIV